MPDGPLLPEIARSLRSLGASRTPCDHEAHDAVFGPLIDARTRAASGSQEKALAALKGASLFTRIEGAAIAAVTREVRPAPRARAFTAEAREMLQPLQRALAAMDDAAAHARDGAEGWALWVDALRAAFMRADSACEALSRMLAERDATHTPARWFKRGG